MPFASGQTLTGTSLESRVAAVEPGSWVPIPLMNSWTAGATPPSVRKLNSTTVQISGTFTVPSTNRANGVQVGTLPAGYRPLNGLDIIGTCDATVAGGQSPHFNVVPTTGAIVAYGFSSAAAAGAFAVFPTNL